MRHFTESSQTRPSKSHGKVLTFPTALSQLLQTEPLLVGHAGEPTQGLWTHVESISERAKNLTILHRYSTAAEGEHTAPALKCY